MPVVVGGWSPTPATRARSTLTAEVARYVMLPNDTDALTVAADGINDAIRKYNLHHWYSSLTYQDISLVADTSGYDLSAPFSAPRHAELLNSSGEPEGVLEFYDPKTFGLEFRTATESGNPSAYTCYNSDADGVLSLNIPPSATYVASYPTLRVRYYAKVAYLTADGHYFDGPAEVESFLCWHARSYVAAHYDPSKIAHAERKAEEFFRMLKVKDNEDFEKDWA